MMRKLMLPVSVWVICVPAFASNGLPEDKEAREILQRAIKAVGGERTLARLKSPMMWMERGTFHGMGQAVPYVAQYAAKWPGWYRQEIENLFTITVSGKEAWVSSAAGVSQLAGTQLAERMKQVRVAWAERLFPLTDEAYKLTKIDGIQVDGRPTVGITASHADHRDIKFFFDKETYLIAKIETMVISPQHGPDPVLSEAFYTDHKSFGGVKMPSKLKLHYDKKLFVETETIDYKMGATLDPKHFAASFSVVSLGDDAEDVWDRVDHHFVKNGDVKIHYVTLGDGKPILFIHGFPDIWYSFRHQMHTLATDYRTAAMDLRGYNKSDQPEGVEHYAIRHILGDVEAVIDDLGGKVTLVGHDWGGAIAWRFAMTRPEKLERLVILNLTHPKGYAAVVSNPTEAQRANTQYARNFAKSKPDGSPVPAGILGIGERMGPVVGKHYREALQRSSYDGMLNYYRANYNRARGGDVPNITVAVLQFHGLKDTAVDKDGLKGTWDWVDKDYTLVTIPNSGHFVQWEAAELVSRTMKSWLNARD